VWLTRHAPKDDEVSPSIKLFIKAAALKMRAMQARATASREPQKVRCVEEVPSFSSKTEVDVSGFSLPFFHLPLLLSSLS